MSTKLGLALAASTLVVIFAAGMPNKASAAPCALTDVDLTIVYPPSVTYTPSSCADGVVQGGGPQAELDSAEAAFDPDLTGFVYLDSSDSATGTGFGGISFVVTADEAVSGNWTVTWTEEAGAPDLPVTVDFLVALIGGNNGSAYLIESVLLPIDPNVGTGTFEVTFLNNGGQFPELSHLLLGGRLVDDDDPQIPVPEPASLLMFGSALVGLGIARHRRRRQV